MNTDEKLIQKKNSKEIFYSSPNLTETHII
jgi:hypothetical protein